MNNLRINHAAVWVCVVLFHVIGFFWYGMLFGTKWMAMVGLDPTLVQEEGADIGVWITNLVAAVAALYALAWVFTRMKVTTGVTGALTAFIIAFCFHHLPLMRSNMFAGDPYGLAWIVGGFDLVALTISGFILGAWRKHG